MIGLCMRVMEPEQRTDVTDIDVWFIELELDE